MFVPVGEVTYCCGVDAHYSLHVVLHAFLTINLLRMQKWVVIT